MNRPTCTHSGAILAANEAQRVARCACGFVADVAPRFNRKVAGQVVEGWSVRLPAHKEPKDPTCVFCDTGEPHEH